MLQVVALPSAVDADGSSARKRKRSSSDPGRIEPRCRTPSEIPQVQSFSQDKEFWFEDGSIVLVSQNVGFRVYKRLLAEHSPIFSDLLSIPQPAEVQKWMNCPVVALTDPPDQLRHLLRVLFPTAGNLAFGTFYGTVSMDAVNAVVRLSHKYQIDHLLAQALSILTEYYTDDFDQWILPDRKTCLDAFDTDAINAIDLAYLTNTPSILPVAFFHASRSQIELKLGDPGDAQNLLGWSLFFSGIFTRILHGRYRFMQASSQALVRILKPEKSPKCEEPRSCARHIVDMASNLDTFLERIHSQPELHTWADEFRDSNGDSDLCAECEAMITARERAERKRLWAMLPEIFDIRVDGWSAT